MLCCFGNEESIGKPNRSNRWQLRGLPWQLHPSGASSCPTILRPLWLETEKIWKKCKATLEQHTESVDGTALCFFTTARKTNSQGFTPFIIFYLLSKSTAHFKYLNDLECMSYPLIIYRPCDLFQPPQVWPRISGPNDGPEQKWRDSTMSCDLDVLVVGDCWKVREGTPKTPSSTLKKCLSIISLLNLHNNYSVCVCACELFGILMPCLVSFPVFIFSCPGSPLKSAFKLMPKPSTAGNSRCSERLMTEESSSGDSERDKMR